MKKTNAHQRIPKLLPWLARKAGVGERRARILWRTAEHHATLVTGESATPAHAQAAMAHLLELLEAESRREDAISFGLRHWARLNTSLLWQMPAALFDAAALNAARSWRLFGHAIR